MEMKQTTNGIIRVNWFARKRDVVLLLAVMMLTSGGASASLVFQESFESYNTGVICGQGQWSGSSSSPATVESDAGLMWSSADTTIDGGNMGLQLIDHGSNNYVDYSQYNGMSSINADAIYVSFLVQGIGLDNDLDDAAFRLASNVGVGFSFDGGSSVIYAQRASGKWASISVSNDKTYFVVAKLWKSISGADQYYDRWAVMLDPVNQDESLNDIAFTLDGSTGRSYITTPRFWGDFYGDGAGKAVYYDDIKIGTAFSDVMPHASAVIPEPTTQIMLTMGTLTAFLLRKRRKMHT